MLIREYFDPYLDYLKQKGRDEKTIIEHTRHICDAIEPALGHVDVKDLHLTDAEKIKPYGHGKFGALRGVSVFRTFCRYLQRSGVKLNFDYRDIELPRVPRTPYDVIEMEEIEKILNAFNTNSLRGLKARAYYELLMVTGLRTSEALNLNRDNIVFEKNEVKIIDIKSKESEIVYLNDRAARWLKLYLSKRCDNYEYLFIGDSHEARLGGSQARRLLKEACKIAGIDKRVVPGTFRKVYATTLLEKGANIKQVQTLCRHKSERTTMKYYAWVSKRRAKEVHQKIMGELSTAPVFTAHKMYDKFVLDIHKGPRNKQPEITPQWSKR